MTRTTMIIVLLVCAYWIFSLFQAIASLAQDTFVLTHGKAACEFWSGTDCARVGRPRTRIVRVPVTTQKLMRHVPEHLAPLRREPEVRGWRRDHDHGRRGRDGPRCWPVSFKTYSGESIAKDACLEAKRRWAGEVRAELGERYMSYANAMVKKTSTGGDCECWQSSTEERAIDKATGTVKRMWRRVKDAATGAERDEEIPEPTGSHERCMVEARPCRAEKTKDSDDE